MTLLCKESKINLMLGIFTSYFDYIFLENMPITIIVTRIIKVSDSGVILSYDN